MSNSLLHNVLLGNSFNPLVLQNIDDVHANVLINGEEACQQID